MKYLIVSDSHGYNDELIDLFNKYKDYEIIHCGDYTSAKEILDEFDAYYVKGNCDSYGEKELVLYHNIGTIYITHGDLYHVKFKYDSLYYRGLELDAKYILFGHTHVPYIEKINGVWLINPGSLKDTKTYVLIEDGIPSLKKI